MIEHNPDKRISAKQLMVELSKLTQIWKTQFCENFLRIKRKKNKSFSKFSSAKTAFENNPFDLKTENNKIKAIRNISNEPGAHVKINEIFLPKSKINDEITNQKNEKTPVKRKKKKRKKMHKSKTLMTNILNNYRSKRNKLSTFIGIKEDLNIIHTSQTFLTFKNYQ